MATPKLRFKGFLDPWKVTRIKNVSDEYVGGGTPKTSKKEYWYGRIPWISSSDLTENNIFDVDIKHYINDKAIEETATKKIDGNSIAIVTRVGVGKLALIKNDFSTSQDFLSLSNLKENPLFLTYCLYLLIQKEKTKLQGTSIKGITKGYLLNLKCDLPVSYVEQSKIGSLIAKIDDLIKLQGNKVETLKQAKKGYLQRIFKNLSESKQRLRPQGFKDDWKEAKLSDLVSIKTGKLDANAMDDNGLYDFYTSGVKTYKINEYAFDGDAITIAGNGANVGYMHLASGKFNAYQRTYVLENFKIDRIYLFYAIGVQMQHVIYNNSRNGNIPYIVMDVLGNMVIPFPSALEQKKISSLLVKLEDMIKLQGDKLERLHELKKGYLQQLFA